MAIEHSLRSHAERSWHPFALSLRRAGGGTFWTPQTLPPDLHGYPAPAHGCFPIAHSLARERGFAIVLGFAAPAADPRPRAHVWNIDSADNVVDAAWHPEPALGYLGTAPTDAELGVLEMANADAIERVRKLSKAMA